MTPWPRMRPMRRAIGLVAVVIGAVWFAQGVGISTESVMSNNLLWAVIGAVVFVVGFVVLYREHTLAKNAIAEDRAAAAAEAAAAVEAAADEPPTTP